MKNEIELLELSAKHLAKIVKVRHAVGLKYKYYEAEQRVRDLGISMPAKLLMLQSGLGWASTAVDMLSDRIKFDAFENDILGINKLNKIADETDAFNLAKRDSMIAGCSFIVIGDDKKTDDKRYTAFTALESTGQIDASSGLLEHGLAITKFNQNKKIARKYESDPLKFADDWILFLDNETVIFEDRRIVERVPNPTGRPLIHIIAHNPTTKEPYGRSVISRDNRLLIQSALRTMRRSEVAAEFYSMPMRYIAGVSEEFEKEEGMDLTLGNIAVVEASEDGSQPKLGQWNQQSFAPYADQLEGFAKQFASNTKISVHDLGLTTSNPSSAESLLAQNEALRHKAETTSEQLGLAIKRLAITLRLATSQTSVVTDEMRNINPHWKPAFRVDIGPAGDAVGKLVQAIPQLKTTRQLYYALGLSVSEADRLISEVGESDSLSQLMGGL